MNQEYINTTNKIKVVSKPLPARKLGTNKVENQMSN
ncbi:hypothetical protein NMY3_01833 [Candidatus Nitrosocosmicus oleophilus]|uniref:Uncharacterized protein n=1 Tax=Candidatus Nitrosocosmicus oleophilus TaxID=1353260 RepID=A0A654M012_9ARCH|nr:hypothetical protein NMY3_01833 [Candidatus Nitrosocosmicus oleophilus]